MHVDDVEERPDAVGAGQTRPRVVVDHQLVVVDEEEVHLLEQGDDRRGPLLADPERLTEPGEIEPFAEPDLGQRERARLELAAT